MFGSNLFFVAYLHSICQIYILVTFIFNVWQKTKNQKLDLKKKKKLRQQKTNSKQAKVKGSPIQNNLKKAYH